MADPFIRFREAARALLAIDALSEREGQFIGGIAYRAMPISDKQANWLRILLAKHGLPPLAEGGENG